MARLAVYLASCLSFFTTSFFPLGPLINVKKAGSWLCVCACVRVCGLAGLIFLNFCFVLFICYYPSTLTASFSWKKWSSSVCIRGGCCRGGGGGGVSGFRYCYVYSTLSLFLIYIQYRRPSEELAVYAAVHSSIFSPPSFLRAPRALSHILISTPASSVMNMIRWVRPIVAACDPLVF